MKKSLFSLLFLGGLLSAAPVNVSFLNAGTPAVALNGVYVGPYTLEHQWREHARDVYGRLPGSRQR